MHIQGNNHANGGAGSPTVAVTLAGQVSAGNALVVTVGWQSVGGDVPTCVDDQVVNVYTLLDLVRDVADGFSLATFCSGNLTNSPQTVTATVASGASRSFCTIFADEYSGVFASALPVDGHTMQAQASVATTPDAITSGNITTTINGDQIYGVTQELTGNGIISAGTGYTQRQSIVQSYVVEDESQSNAGIVAATFTTSVSGNFISAVVALRPSPPVTASAMRGFFLRY
jgi:hypothetical protein